LLCGVAKWKKLFSAMPVSESMKQRSEIFDYRRKQVHGSTKTEKNEKKKIPRENFSGGRFVRGIFTW
jgi:hypothetical protein